MKLKLLNLLSNRLNLIYIFVIISIFFPGILQADIINVKSSISTNKVGIEDSFIYTIDVETDSNQDLDIEVKIVDYPADYLRPSISTSVSSSIINGSFSISRTESYKYTSYAREEGRLKIPALEVKVNGDIYYTQEHTLEIVPGSIRVKKQQQQRRSPFGSFFDDWDSSPGLSRRVNKSFIEVKASHDSVYVGQNLQAQYYYYTQDNSMGISYEMLDSEGFGISESKTIREGWERVNYQGDYYFRREISTFSLTAQEAGKQALPQILLVESRFFANNTVKSPNKFVKVKELPQAGKSIDYSNAIGVFEVSAELNQQTMFDNQQNHLIITISGRGNFSSILYPQAPKVEGLEILKPRASIDVNENNEGKIILTYDIIPSGTGMFRIPPVSFNYFDEQEAEYKTIYTESSILNVKSTRSSVDSSHYSTPAFYTKNQPHLGKIKKQYLLTKKSLYWVFLAIQLLALLAYLVFYHYKKKLNSNIVYVNEKEALRILSDSVKACKILAEKRDKNFYTRAQNMLLKFIAVYTNQSLQLSQQALIKYLETTKIDDSTVNRIGEFLSYCERIKFQPGYQSEADFDKDKQVLEEIFTNVKSKIGKQKL